MALIISHALHIEREVIARGYAHKPWRHGELGIRRLINGNKCVVIIRTIEIALNAYPSITAGGGAKPLSTTVDEYFKRLHKSLEGIIKRHVITNLALPGSGCCEIPLPGCSQGSETRLPDWFRGWCAENGIQIQVVNPGGIGDWWAH